MTTGKRASAVAGKESEPQRRGGNKGDRTNTCSAANDFGKERIRICDKNSSAGDGSYRAAKLRAAPRQHHDRIIHRSAPLITRPINRLHRNICPGNAIPASMQTCGIVITKTQPSGNCNWGTKFPEPKSNNLPSTADIPLASGNNQRPLPSKGDEPCSTAQP